MNPQLPVLNFLSVSSPPPRLLQELRSQLETQGKVEPSSFLALVTVAAARGLAAAERVDLEAYRGRVQAWEDEKKHLVSREKEMREKSELEKQEREAARAAAQQA